MKQRYQDIQFQAKTRQLIDLVNGIAEEYQEKGYKLTLRQMYYQLVARGYVENTQRSYKNVGNAISKARIAGLIDWDIITDRLRSIRGTVHDIMPSISIGDLAQNYRIDKWQAQANYCEVWVEKDALIDVVGQACAAIDTPHMSNRGYSSTTAMRDAAQRFIDHADKDGRYIIYLGDHDPSGVDMTRDIEERLRLFGADVKIKRIALTVEQIQTYNPPPAPAKVGDSRTRKYIQENGAAAWEVDALDPEVLHDLIQEEVINLIDIDKFNLVYDLETKQRAELFEMARNYNRIQELLKQA